MKKKISCQNTEWKHFCCLENFHQICFTKFNFWRKFWKKKNHFEFQRASEGQFIYWKVSKQNMYSNCSAKFSPVHKTTLIFMLIINLESNQTMCTESFLGTSRIHVVSDARVHRQTDRQPDRRIDRQTDVSSSYIFLFTDL